MDELVRSGFLKNAAGPPFDFLLKIIHAHALHGIFQPAEFTILPVAEVALGGDDRFAKFHDIRCFYIAQHIRQAWKCGRHAKGHAQSAPGGQVEPNQVAVFFNSDQPDVIGKNIGVVLGWYRQRNFELAGQVGFAVNRLRVPYVPRRVGSPLPPRKEGECIRGSLAMNSLCGGGSAIPPLYGEGRGGFLYGEARRGNFFAIEPDLRVGRCLRREDRAQFPGQGVGGGMHAAFLGIGAAHHVAVHVAAAGDAVQQHLVETQYRGFQLALAHPVQLEGLAGGEFERAVAIAVGEFVHAQPLCGRGYPARYPHPDHQ